MIDEEIFKIQFRSLSRNNALFARNLKRVYYRRKITVAFGVWQKAHAKASVVHSVTRETRHYVTPSSRAHNFATPPRVNESDDETSYRTVSACALSWKARQSTVEPEVSVGLIKLMRATPLRTPCVHVRAYTRKHGTPS